MGTPCAQPVDVIARYVPCSVRSIKRYLAELRAAGMIVRQRRGNLPDICKVLAPREVPFGTTVGPSYLRINSVCVEGSLLKENKEHNPVVERVGDLFEEFMGIFVAAGVAMNERDLIRCCQMWVSLEPDEQRRALEDARRKALGGAWPTPNLTKRPWNYLRDQEWTRTAMPRVLPMHRRTVGEEMQSAAERRFLEGAK